MEVSNGFEDDDVQVAIESGTRVWMLSTARMSKGNHSNLAQ
jgi:hypothetical protein